MKKNYVAPDMEMMAIDTEGCLCSSTQDSPGVLDPNESWLDDIYGW